ncbi:MAG: DEAD/DEAH box helicase [Micrococcales bacterium]|nr:DEAD/DEAH box helicase [Micrococcales bacterium]
MTLQSFAQLRVPTSLCDILAADGITTPTPIQAATLPDSLAGRDVLGRGRTGSGKTYAFLLPLVARLVASREAGRVRRPRMPRALILAPTRELAGQIEAALKPLAAATSLRTLAIFGGVNQNPQVRALAAGIDVLVACPGRLEDLVGQRHVNLSAVEIAVLDEADHMADLGFLPGVKRILDATPQDGQRLLFSATLDGDINVIVKRYLRNPVTHHADSAQSSIGTMSHHVLHVTPDQRVDVVADLAAAPGRTVVFTRTKHGAKKLAKQLNKVGVSAVELHGNLAQGARTRNLEAFHSGNASTLVATDIAARGIHVDDVELVIHADPPVEHKAYLHRSGRTARAGADGTVITMMTDDQVRDVRALTKAAGIRPTTTRVAPGHAMLATLAPGERRYAQGDATPFAPAQPQPARARSNSGSARSGGARRNSSARSTVTTDASRGSSALGSSSRGSSGRGGGGQGRAPARAGASQSSGAPRGAAAFSSRSSAGRRGR